MIHWDLWSISVVPLGRYSMEVEQQHASQMESGFLIQGKSCVSKVSSAVSVLTDDDSKIVVHAQLFCLSRSVSVLTLTESCCLLQLSIVCES